MNDLKSQKDSLLSCFILLLILIGNAVFLNYNAFRGFNTYDMGWLMDGSWRIYRGQRPYLDFIYHGGVLFLYLNAFFFQLFSPGKLAVLSHLIVVHSVVICAVFLMLQNKVPLRIQFLVVLLTVPSFYWSVSHPWHDQTAHLWGILAMTYLVRNSPLLDTKTAGYAGLIAGIMAIFSFLSKSNIGVGYGIVFGGVFMISDRRRETILGYFLGISIGMLLALLLIGHPKEFLEQTFLHTQAVLKERSSLFFVSAKWLINYYWIPFLVVFAQTLLLFLPLPVNQEKSKTISWQQNKELLILFAGTTGIGIYAILSGAMVPQANNFLWGIQMALAFIYVYRLKNQVISSWSTMLHRICTRLLILISIFLTGIAIKYGLELKAWTYIPGNPIGNYALKTPPLNGWMFDEGKGKPLDAMCAYIRENVPPQDSLLNLSDMYVLYALTGRDSYHGIPTVFWRKSIPAEGQQVEQVRTHILQNQPQWLIIDSFSSRMELDYLQLNKWAEDCYAPIFKTGDYELLQLKNSCAAL